MPSTLLSTMNAYVNLQAIADNTLIVIAFELARAQPVQPLIQQLLIQSLTTSSP